MANCNVLHRCTWWRGLALAFFCSNFDGLLFSQPRGRTLASATADGSNVADMVIPMREDPAYLQDPNRLEEGYVSEGSLTHEEQVAKERAGGHGNASSPPPPSLQCGLYLAESTIPNAGVGVFTGVPLKTGDYVEEGQHCVPIVNRKLNLVTKMGFKNPFADFQWSSNTMGMFFESWDLNDIQANCFGMGAQVNADPLMLNADGNRPIYHGGNLQRTRDPGAGAFTPYYNVSTQTLKPVPAGGELFIYYGNEYFTSRQDFGNYYPLQDDYKPALRLLKKFMALNFLDQRTHEDLYMVVQGIGADEWESRVLNAIPATYEQARQAVAANDIAVVRQDETTRSLSWLAEHGRCIDHIRTGPSTLPQAGRGAFAARDLPQGTIVSTSPLYHIPDKAYFNMYQLPKHPGFYTFLRIVAWYLDGYHVLHRWFRYPKIRSYQLMRNYCFGHAPSSSLLLCPYAGFVNFINHNQTQANVKIQWAKDFTVIHQNWLLERGTVSDLRGFKHPVLAFDYVATRDIQEGEELFLDYGDLWEQAWNQHVATYKTRLDEAGITQYMSAEQVNEAYGDVILKTQQEQKKTPYPRNLRLRCHFDLLKYTLPSKRRFVWRIQDPGETCIIVKRYADPKGGDEPVYTVEITLRQEEEEWVERTNVPRSAIRFFDAPESTDYHALTAFRHEIQIPDDMFPENWRNDTPWISYILQGLGFIAVTYVFYYYLP